SGVAGGRSLSPQPRQSMPMTRTPLGNSGAASSIHSLQARLPWRKTTVTSPSPHSHHPSWTSPALTRGMGQAYLFRPTVGEVPAGLAGTGALDADVVIPLMRRSVASGELVSTLPVVTRSVTSAAYSTGLSVWMKW